MSEMDPRTANRRMGWQIFAIMLVIAGLALAFAIWTIPQRRGNDPPPATKTTPP